MHKRGLSDVVTTVLFILAALAAVAIIWNFIQPLLGSSGINTQQFTTRLSVPEDSVSIDPNTNLAFLKIDRQAGDGDIAGFIIGLTDPEGNVKTFRQNLTINQLELKNLVINYSDAALDDVLSISVTPIFKNNETGKEVLGQPITQPVKNKTSSYKLPNGLVAHWKFDENWNDASVNNIHGSVVGNVAFDSGNKKIGSASGNFPGASTSYVSVPNNNLLNLNQFTVVAWVRPESLSGFTTTNIVTKFNPSTGFAVVYELSSNSWQFRTRGVVNYLNITESNSLNSWNFIAASMNSNNQKTLYYNTLSTSTSAPSYTPSSSSTSTNIGQLFDGNIDEVMFFNRALTSQEIQDIRTKYK